MGLILGLGGFSDAEIEIATQRLAACIAAAAKAARRANPQGAATVKA